MPNWLKKVAEYAAVLGVLFWGVPYYIDHAVEERMKELTPEPPDIGEAAPVVELSTKVNSLAAGQERIESKVDAFSSQFLAYLERQAQ